jgi:hypothetical protein
MKTNTLRSAQGSVLLSASMTAGVLAILVAGFLSYLSNESNLNYRAHRWNQSFHLAEAAVETGIAEYNYWYYQGSNGFQSSRGWTDLGGNSYSKTITNLTDASGNVVGTLSVTASNINTTNPKFQGVGTVTSSNYGGPSIARAVQVSLAPSPRFPLGLMALSTIDLNGNNIYTDSYDSSDSTKSTNGSYDSAKKQPNGNIGTDDNIINSIDIGNAEIFGTVSTGPSGTVTMGPNGTVGPSFSDPAESVSEATANGWIQNNFDVGIPDVTLPSGFGSVSSSGSIDNDNTTINAGGGTVYQKYSSIDLHSKTLIVTNGTVNLYVTGDTSITGSGSIIIKSGASLTMYAGGSVTLSGNGMVNNSGSATSAQFFGLPTSTSWSISGNGQWVGTVYAPEADLSMNGGGSQGDVSGAFVTKSITLNGHTKFHYDETLKKTGPVNGYLAASWQELSYVNGSWIP